MAIEIYNTLEEIVDTIIQNGDILVNRHNGNIIRFIYDDINDCYGYDICYNKRTKMIENDLEYLKSIGVYRSNVKCKVINHKDYRLPTQEEKELFLSLIENNN